MRASLEEVEHGAPRVGNVGEGADDGDGFSVHADVGVGELFDGAAAFAAFADNSAAQPSVVVLVAREVGYVDELKPVILFEELQRDVRVEPACDGADDFACNVEEQGVLASYSNLAF